MLVAISLAFVLVSRPAHADDEKARVHFKRGIDLYDKKQYEPALEAFRAVHQKQKATERTGKDVTFLRGICRKASKGHDLFNTGSIAQAKNVRGMLIDRVDTIVFRLDGHGRTLRESRGPTCVKRPTSFLTQQYIDRNLPGIPRDTPRDKNIDAGVKWLAGNFDKIPGA